MIPVYKPFITELEQEYVAKAMESTWISSKGEFLEQFEGKLRQFLGAKHVILTNSGTSACHLALLAAGIGPGDEVIIPDSTYVATANAVRYCGATPVLVDVSKDSWNINTSLIAAAITEKTKAIFVVHLMGYPCFISHLKSICEQYNLLLIEDACEAFGGMYEEQKLGTIGLTGAFSFFGNKVITTGEGGCVVTNDDRVAEYIRLFQGQGQTEPYFHPVIGYNYRMTNVAAAIGCAQMDNYSVICAQKLRLNELYYGYLHKHVRLQPQSTTIHKSANWMTGITVPEHDRNHIIKQLSKEGIDTRKWFQPIHELPPYRQYKSSALPISYKLSRTGIMLPSYPELRDWEVEKISDIILRYVR